MLENSEVLSWDSVLDEDEVSFTLLEDGDYFFKVEKFERAMYQGGANVPACPKAIVYFEIYNGSSKVHIHESFLLCKSLIGKLTAFFRSIGLKKPGEKLQMDWSKVTGKYGKCHVTKRFYINKNNVTKTINTIDRYLDYNEEEIKKFLNEKEINEMLGDDISDSDLPF